MNSCGVCKKSVGFFSLSDKVCASCLEEEKSKAKEHDVFLENKALTTFSLYIQYQLLSTQNMSNFNQLCHD